MKAVTPLALATLALGLTTACAPGPDGERAAEIDGPWQLITRPGGIGPVYDFREDGSVTAISTDGERSEGSYRFPAPGEILIELEDGESLRARYAIEEGILTLHAVGATEPQRYFRAPLD